MLDFTSESAVRRITNFAELARTGHFGRASVRLGISQPALSRSIQSLERDVGVALLRRHAKGVDLTAEGASVLALCSTIQKSMDRIRGTATDACPKTTLSIGLCQTLSAHLTPLLYGALSRQFPDLRLAFSEADCDAVEQDLLHHNIDLGLLFDPVETDRLCTVPLLQERLDFVCSPQFDLALLPSSLRLADLPGVPMVLPSPDRRLRRLIQRAERQQGIELRPVIEIDSPATIRALVHDGLGATLATGRSVAPELRRGALQSRPIGSPVLSTTLHLAHRAGEQGADMAAITAAIAAAITPK